MSFKEFDCHLGTTPISVVIWDTSFQCKLSPILQRTYQTRPVYPLEDQRLWTNKDYGELLLIALRSVTKLLVENRDSSNDVLSFTKC